MAGILFHFEPEFIDVFSGRDASLDAWNYACKAAGDIDKVVIIDKTGKAKPFDISLDTQILSSVDMWEPPQHYTLVDVPWTRAIPVDLWDFDHQTDFYCFGPAAGWRGELSSPHVVTVPQAGQGALHATHIASAVMLHRHHIIGGK